MERTISYKEQELKSNSTNDIEIPSIWMYLGEKHPSSRGEILPVYSEDELIHLSIILVEQGLKYRPVKLYENGNEITDYGTVKQFREAEVVRFEDGLVKYRVH